MAAFQLASTYKSANTPGTLAVSTFVTNEVKSEQRTRRGPGRGGRGAGRGGRGQRRGSDETKNENDKLLEVQPTCYTCGKKGHKSPQCPDKPTDKSTDKSKTCNAIRVLVASDGIPPPMYDCDVLLDTQSEVHLMNSKFLDNVRTVKPVQVKGVGSDIVMIRQKGWLKGVGECLVSDEIGLNILSYALVRDQMYTEYNHVEDVHTIYTPDGNIRFHRVGNLYVGDMSAWTSESMLCASTSVLENMLTAKELERAREAHEFIARAGFPSEKEAVALVTNGNILSMSITAKDVRNAYGLWGRHPEYIRGRARRAKPSRAIGAEQEPIDLIREQVLTVDVMHVGGQTFLLGLSEPLNVVLNSHLTKMNESGMLDAIMAHIDTLSSFGFKVNKVFVDPQSSMAALRTKLTNVEVDVSGAGDHLPHLDVRMKVIKEICRSVNAGLPWNLPQSLVKDLVQYSVSRYNCRGGTGEHPLVSPKVAMTGRKPSMKKEYGLQFGEYVECYNLTGNTNNALRDRTDPSIALHPTGNANESWTFLNLTTMKRVTRSNWTKMVTTNLVIDRMNEMALKEQNGKNVEPLTDIDEPISSGVDESAPTRERSTVTIINDEVNDDIDDIDDNYASNNDVDNTDDGENDTATTDTINHTDTINDTATDTSTNTNDDTADVCTNDTRDEIQGSISCKRKATRPRAIS